MPFRCCVPDCNGNYPKGPKVSVFGFPKDDVARTLKWLSAIQRKDFQPSKSSKVCERHFIDSDYEKETSAFDKKACRLVSSTLNVKRLASHAIPSVFSFSSPSTQQKPAPPRPSPDDRNMERELNSFQQAVNKSLSTEEQYTKERSVSSMEDVLSFVKTYEPSQFWTLHIPNVNTICFLNIATCFNPVILYSIKIENLMVSVYIKENPIEKLKNYSFPFKVSSVNELTDVLDMVQALEGNCNTNNTKAVIEMINNFLDAIITDENELMVKFIQEQLLLLTVAKNNLRYSSELLVFASLLSSISSSAYKFLRNSKNFILPHPTTIRNVCNHLPVSAEAELCNSNFLKYIKNRVRFVSDSEKTVILLLDEIHIKPFLDYKGGTVVGTAFDSPALATSVFVFMISSVLSSFKEVVHIMPVSTIVAETLSTMIKKVIVGLESASLNVICVITDNNSINRKAMSFFAEEPCVSFKYKHPVHSDKPLYFLIDSVHLFKNIRNNWINQKNPGTCFFFPNLDSSSFGQGFCTASFAALRKLYDVECMSVIKYARGLSYKTLYPSNLERQNVKLVMNVFNDFVVQGLLEFGSKHKIEHYKDTSNFIQYICLWWAIMNVKAPNKGICKRNEYMMPLTNNKNDNNLAFLNKFVLWLDLWKGMHCQTGSFSKETHDALKQTTEGIMELVHYCSEQLQMRYILPGKFQTDCLEERFGKYRRYSGCNYLISCRQLLESEKKLRIQSCIKLELSIQSKSVPLQQLEFFDNLDDLEEEIIPICIITVSESDINNTEDYLPVLTYIGGYCSHIVLKSLKCEFCKEFLLQSDHDMCEIQLHTSHKLITKLDRGALKYPSTVVVNAVVNNYIVLNKILEASEAFYKNSNQRLLISNSTYNLLEYQEMVVEGMCHGQHLFSQTLKRILWVCTNIMLKNFCNLKNDIKKKSKDSKKRKLNTFANKK